ncbi:MAG: ATPase [Gammaproteobacteria bacterium]|nr:ATPase [Gammaproteobacteria bacterium]MBT8445287.1 ATPase [Gammaproteobacteria bacterium]NND35868.1 ATPase [Gammaproteobacteria bacterium]
MRMTRDEFLAWPRKAVTLLGMSGVGKTWLANKLPKTDWFHYSGDYRIGTKYLAEPILDNIKRKAMQVDFLRDLLRSDSIYIANNISVHNLEPVSTFLGKIGRADLGGLDLNEFKRRQRLHLAAESAAMRDVAEFIGKAHEIYGYDHFLNDAGGSICELPDDEPLRVLREHTLILYLRAGPNMEEELIRRAAANPKPLYFAASFLDEKLAIYLAQKGLQSADEIIPNDFVQWIFPELLEHRRPLYEAIADQHGYSVDARDISSLRDENDFVELVADAIARKDG